MSLDASVFGLFTRESDFFFALFTRKNLRKIDSNLPSNFDNRCQHFRPKKDDGNTLPILPGCKLQMLCRYHLRVSLFLSLAVFYLDSGGFCLFKVRALFFAFLCARACNACVRERRGSRAYIHGARKKFLGARARLPLCKGRAKIAIPRLLNLRYNFSERSVRKFNLIKLNDINNLDEYPKSAPHIGGTCARVAIIIPS